MHTVRLPGHRTLFCIVYYITFNIINIKIQYTYSKTMHTVRLPGHRTCCIGTSTWPGQRGSAHQQ